MEQPLQDEQFPAAALKLVRWLRGQFAEAELPPLRPEPLDLLRRQLRDKLRVVLLLVDHRHEPVFEPQIAGP